MRDREFTYKNHECVIEFDVEPEECIKAWHWVTKPNGEKVCADLSPYDWNETSVELWIDAGYPKRIGTSPLNVHDLRMILAIKEDQDAMR
jgi:hypothetical protein